MSVFSLIMVNFANVSTGNLTKEFIVPMNLSLGIVIVLFIGLILIFLNKADNKCFLWIYIGIMLLLIVSLWMFL